MSFSGFWHESWTAAIVNHLWQSTVVVGIAWLLTLALRKNYARGRYWVWMAASVKFLFPFSLLIGVGEWMRSLLPAAVAAQPAVADVMEQVTQPFGSTDLLNATPALVPAHHGNWLPWGLLAAWFCGALAVAIDFGREWRRVHAAKRAARPIDLAAGVPVYETAAQIEPGTFGISGPILLLPEGILDRLTAEQMQAVVAHEMCHVRRRDNLTFAIHMAVETLFWFHPAVWWIGSRLIDERERSCDEAVVQAGAKARVYAEGILNVCKFYAESPLGCISGVTGADLKKRILRIVSEQGACRLSRSRMLLFSIVVTLALAVPVALGVVRAEAGQNDNATAQDNDGDAQDHTPASSGMKPKSFEVVSIKPNKEGTAGGGQVLPNGERYLNAPLDMLIKGAYGTYSEGQVVGLPSWAKSERYDIEVRVDSDTANEWKNLSNKERWKQEQPMLQAMFADRCKLRVHFETKELPVYDLVIAKGGLKMKESAPADKSMERVSNGRVIGRAISIENIVHAIPSDGRLIVDKTDQGGKKFDFDLKWTPDNQPVDMDSGPSLFTALEEQLGLRLVSSKAQERVLVIDHIERPTPN